MDTLQNGNGRLQNGNGHPANFLMACLQDAGYATICAGCSLVLLYS
jgi:hypothetical protein